MQVRYTFDLRTFQVVKILFPRSGVSTHVIATFHGKKSPLLYNKNFIAFGITFAQGQKAKARFQQLYFPNILTNLTNFF